MARKAELDVRKVLTEFQQSETSNKTHRGTFRIKASFDQALDTILKTIRKRIDRPRRGQ